MRVLSFDEQSQSLRIGLLFAPFPSFEFLILSWIVWDAITCTLQSCELSWLDVEHWRDFALTG